MHAFNGPILEVDLSRLVANYQHLRRAFTGQECAATVKANAYGLGVEAVATALADAGCQTFFVATLDEGIALRDYVPDRKIAVFHGVGEGEALAFINHRLIPVLNSPQQIARWREVALAHADAPSILHIDTGMARLGLTETEYAALNEKRVAECQISLIMSHLSCASDPDHEMNHLQLDQFIRQTSHFPELPTSLANSGGIFLGEAWHDDLARPGCGLYGITPNAAPPSMMEPVVRLSVPVIQIRTLDSDQPIGYGATETLPKGTKLATVAFGYADGCFRSLSHRLGGYIGGYPVRLVGRVTMDMLTFDVSAVPESLLDEQARVELINRTQTVNDLAAMADTIGYEILTRIGPRVRRVYGEWE